MFAFCILDKFKNKFFLARDRFGEKPLFYFVNNNIFGFSSEISSFEKCKYLKLDLSTTNLQNTLLMVFSFIKNNVSKSI